MMELTDEQKLEITETIARACGWPFRSITNQPQIDVGVWIPFNPFTDWNDAMRAADALGVEDHSFIWTWEKKWEVSITEYSCHEDGYGREFLGLHPDRLTAFCLALHEIAKAKLEEK